VILRRGLGYLVLLMVVSVALSGCTGGTPPTPPTNTDPYYNPPTNTDPYNNPPTNTDPYNNPPTNTDPYNNSSKININTADHAELDTLPGIGPVLADEIINYRFFYGPFQTPHDIVNVRGIGEAKYAAIANMITTYGGGSSYYHSPTPPTDPYAGGGTSGKLNINIATQAELETLPGIGPAKARAIIDYRTRYGKFQRKEDVKLVSGIADATFAKIEPYIVAKGGAVTNSELDLAYRNYTKAYQRFSSMQNDPYSSYSEQRRAYDEYLSAKKEYDRLAAKYSN